MSLPEESDRAFGRLVVEQGLTSAANVDECLALVTSLRDRGVTPVPTLGEMLVQKGYLTSWAYERTIKAPSTASTTAPEMLPPEVQAVVGTPGRDLGKRILVSPMGRGGMGEVWKAWERDLGRFVAVKLVRGKDPEDARQIVREAQVVARLIHPNIVPVHEVGTHEGQAYFVMQLVSGPTIDRAGLDEKAALEAIRDAALALDFAHGHGIVHRDIKPSNLMIEGRRVYLMDFGLARLARPDAEGSQEGKIAGTPQYMSPEQARGQATIVGPRSDLYSLGATLYTLLAGSPPYPSREGEDLVGLLRRVAGEEPPPPRRVKPSVSRDAETIVLKCMAKEPSQRYATATELAEDLQRCLSGEPIRGTRAGVLYRLRKKAAKHRWAVLGGAAAVVLALSFGAYLVGARVLRDSRKAQWLDEAGRAERDQRWDQALAGYERAHALDVSDRGVREKKEEMARRVRDEREKLQRENAQKAAALVYRESERELYLLRMRSYQPQWRLSDEEFKQFEDVIVRCRKQLKATGDSGDGWWVVGRAHHILGDWGTAGEDYDRGLRAEPDHPACLIHKARLLMEESLIELPTSLANRSVRLRVDAKVQEALRLLRVGVATGRVPELELDLVRGLEKVIAREPTAPYCAGMLEKWKGKDFSEEFHIVRGLGLSGNLMAEAEDVLQVRPSCAEAYLWRGWARALFNVPGWREDFDQALRINPRFVQGYLQRGQMRRMREDPAGAIQDLTRLLELNPKHAPAFLSRAAARRETGDLKGSLEDCDRGIELDPTNSDGYQEKGVTLLMMGDTEGSVREAERYRQRIPTWAEAKGLVDLPRDPARLEKVRAIYEEALARNPRDAVAITNRGVVRQLTGDPDGAIRDHTEALRILPSLNEAYNNLGVAHLEKGDLKAAAADLERSIQINPLFEVPRVNRGVVRALSGDMTGAIQNFSEVLGYAISRSWAQLNRAAAYEKLAQKEPDRFREFLQGAEADYENVRILMLGDPSHPHAQAAVKGLARVRERLARPKGE